jgi:hypothetical protein
MFKRAALLSLPTLLGVLLAAAPALAAPPSPSPSTILSPSSGQLEFGEVALHYGGQPKQSVTFSDMQPVGSVDVESVAIGGADPANFQIVGDDCSGAQLELGWACSVEVTFNAGSTPGAHSATLELLTSEGPIEIPLTGSAITGTLSASPSPLTFDAIPFTAPGSHSEGENSETEQVQLRNSANASTEAQSASITGPDASSFSIQWNCDGVVLGTNSTCTVGIRFQPTSPGPKSATLTIGSDSAGSPLEVPLAGVGLHGPQLTLNTTQALLGNVALGASAQQTFTVTDSGDYLLFIERTFLVTGTPLMFPVLSDACSGEILEPGQSCAITVAFRPTTLGEKDASLLFITNTPAINVAGVDGVGIQAPSEAAPSLAAPLTSASGGGHVAAVAAAPTPPASLVSPPAASESTSTPPAPLTALRPPRLYSLLGHTTIDPGADVQCPAGTQGCEALSFVLPAGASRSSANGFGHAPALLGSALIRLHAGQGAHVRVPLSPQAAKRLKRLGHMHVRLSVVLQAGGAILAQHTWTVELSAAGAVVRL